MKTLDIAEAPALLAKYAADPNQEPVILMVARKPVAVVLPTQGADVETVSLSFNPKFLEIIERSRIREAREGTISSEEMRRRFGLKPYVDPKAKKDPKARTKSRQPKTGSRKRNGREDGSQV
jgi:hypothetical protein